MAKVELRNVTKVFDKSVTAVDNVSFEITDHEFMVLVGPSGCGKSTTLRMIAGLEEITDGEIYIGDTVVNDVPPKDRDIAMVFQNYALYPHMTVYQNMAFGLKLRKYPKKEIESRVADAADILGIQELMDRKPKALSGGQRQRVAVGRAIVRKPQVFLFDEPLSNLDAKLRVQMRAEISKLHARLESTMVYVTHDQVEAMTMGDRIVVMKDGIIQQLNTPLNLYNHPKNLFVAGFIGSPAMNFMNGTIEKSDGLWFRNGHLRLGVARNHLDILEPYADKKVILGIRPDDIYQKGYAVSSDDISEGQSVVEVVEPMGSEIYLYLDSGDGNTYIARITAVEEPPVGSSLDMQFDMSKAHYFDLDTEKSIDFTE